MITKNIFSFCKKYKKPLFLGLFIVFLFAVFGESAFANEPAPTTGLDSETTRKIVQALNYLLTGASAIMALITSLVTMFLYPGWVNGTLFGLQDYLKIIWILVSNVVYFIFAFILIAIAFMNIIGRWEGTWELKQAMPKFIIGVLIVPFSWFFVQFVLSISAILTVGVLTLPYDAFQGETLLQEAVSGTQLWQQEICKDIVITLTGEAPQGSAGIPGLDGESLGETLYCKDGDGIVTIEEIFTGTNGGEGLNDSIFGIISVYTYGILRIQDLDTLDATSLSTVTKIADLVFKIFFDVVFVLAYMLLMVALFLALFVRWVRLWIYMMLSPAFGLLYFFGKGSEGVGGDKAKFSIKEFINLALVPVYVSAALSFGLVFCLVASEWIRDKASDGASFDRIQIGWFSLEIQWAHGGNPQNGTVERSPIAKLIVEIFGVVILWIAVMAALKASHTTEQITNPIREFGNSVWDLAMKAPTYAPIIPTPDGKWLSAAGLASAGSQFKSAVAGQQTSRWSEFGTNMARNLWVVDSATSQLTNSMSRFSDSLDGANTSTAVRTDALRTLMSNTSASDLATNRQMKREFNQFMERMFGAAFTADMAQNITTASQWNLDVRLRDIFREISATDATAVNNVFGSAQPTSEDIMAILRGGSNTTDERIDPSGTDTPAPGVGSNINVTVQGITTANAAERAQAFDGTIRASDLRTRLESEWITAQADQNAIIDAFTDASRIIAEAAADWE